MHEEECRRSAAHLSVGITGVEAAFAGTGSIALLPGKGRSRAAALLTLYHIAVIPFSCIYPSIEAWMEVARKAGNLDDRVRRGSQLAFVTGPSKSADIELNLTLGVHGPKMVHAVIFDDG
jgi:L-lactate dehydrogenase complex protein LldG